MPSTAHSSTPLSSTLELAVDLLARRSITPDDAGCQDLIIKRLEAIGFRVERLRFGEVDNFWAERGGSGPLLAFAGHTDVVPTGPVEQRSEERRVGQQCIDSGGRVV